METLKKKIEKRFRIKIKDMQPIKDERKTYVARIVTMDNRKYAVKSGFLPVKHQEFIVCSEKLLSDQGIPLARPVRGQDKKLYFKYKGHPYVLYEWVEGEEHPLRDLSDLKSIIQTIARMHHASYNIKYPRRTRILVQKHKEKQYLERIKSFDRFLLEYRHSTDPKINEFVRAVPYFRNIAKKALYYLRISGYNSLLKKSLVKHNLVHGDAHPGNVLRHQGRNVLIDFEDIRYDLPSSDLLRLFNKYSKRHPFQAKTFEKMMEWYEEVNPLSPSLRKLVLIDCLFPHSFLRLFRLKKFEGQSMAKIQHMIEQEKRLSQYLLKTYFKKSFH